MSHPISNDWFHRIKAATRDLVSKCGGVERAGEKAHVSRSEASRWQNSANADIIPLTAILALENDCKIPFITKVMAELNGRALSDPTGETVENTASIVTQHTEAVIAAAKMMAAGASVFADGKLTPCEADVLDRSVAEVERSIAPLRRDLAGAKAAGRKLKVV